MSNFDTSTSIPTTHTPTTHTSTRRVSTETKASFKTTEFIAYVVIVIAVLVASAVADGNNTGFGAKTAWFYITILTIGYMISRGLAKSGSRDFYTDDSASSHNGR
jgi:hypothetical protein